MANPDFLDVLGDEMGRVYEACSDRIMVNLARYFKYLKPGETPGGAFQYQAKKLAEFGQVNRESIQIIKDMMQGADPALRDCLEAAIVDALETVEPELRKAAEAGLLGGGNVPPQVDPRTMEAFRLYYQQSADKLNLVNTVMLESTENAYRATVSDIVNRMQRAQTIVDTATGQVVTGVESFNQALKQATQQMVENGITGFVDHGGHRWRPETYVAMDMRTTFHNVSREAFWERNEEYGNDLYLVSQHPGARPLCYPWQCKVISRTDQARDVTDGADQPVHVYAQSETRYGEPAGLFGINCGHHPELFIPGATKVPELRQNEEENARTYAESQKQRKLEREFRKARLDLDVAKAQGDEEGLKQARGRLEKADERLERFVNETGRKRRREREYAPMNAKWPEEAQTSAGKALTDGGRSGTIKADDVQIFRTLGAAARNYDIKDVDGSIYRYVEGTRVQDVEIFAGFRTRHPLRDEVAEGLMREFGGVIEKWQHVKGNGIVDVDGEAVQAEIHWFQEETVGQVKHRIKRWLE